MNWNKLQKKYPKGVSLFKEFTLENCVNNWATHITFTKKHIWIADEGGTMPWHPRSLFDFFDENHINIQITTEYYVDGINWMWQILWHTPNTGFDKESQSDGTMQHGDNNEYKNREKAEYAAYKKAFEILEDVLTELEEVLSS